MKITIKSLKQLTYDVEISEISSVSELKKLVEEKHGFDSSNMKLLYTGIILEDKKTLSEYNMKEPNSYIVTMLNVKVKPKNLVKEEEKVEENQLKEVVKSENLSDVNKEIKGEKVENYSSTKKQPGVRQKVEKVFEEYNAQLKQLVDMGFSQELAKTALHAAKGDIPTAIEFLYSGIPNVNKVNPAFSEFIEENEDEEDEGQVELNQDAINNIDLNDPNAIKNISSVVKVIINEDPDQLQNLLEDIEEINPEIIEYIKKNESEFKSLISKPITSEDILVFNQLMGGKDEEDYDEEELMGEGIHNILANANNFDNLNSANMTSNVAFTPSEKESIERIKALGFSEIDVVQAFIACDKNEELTANFLFENKYKDEDMEIDYDESSQSQK